jgi:hypothetical protein
MAKKITGETLRQREAFEFYYSLGDSRNLKKVAQEFGVSDRTVEIWSKKYGWQERVVQKNIEVGKLLSDRMNEEIVTEKARYRALIKVVINDVVSSLKEKDGTIKVKSIQDLERLIKLDLLLMGEATENTSSTVSQSVTMTAEDREDLKTVVESIREVFDGVELDTQEQQEEEDTDGQ